MQHEIVTSTNRLITATLSGPHEPLPTTASSIIAGHGIAPADTRLLSQWFSNAGLVPHVAGRFGYVTTGHNQTNIRVFEPDEAFYELKIRTPKNVDYFATIGRYFGYRPCCAEYYSNMRRRPRNRNRPPVRKEPHQLYLHCLTCQQQLQPYDKSALEQEIRTMRVSPTRFPFHRTDIWIKYQIFDAVFKGEMDFTYLKDKPRHHKPPRK